MFSSRIALGLSGVLLGLSVIVVFAAPRAVASKPAATRVFEMRTYVTHPGRLDALNKRFRDHTTALLKKHGMENIGYWVPKDEKDGKDNTLVYLLAHESRESAAKSWAAFQADPEWIKVRNASEESGKIVLKVTPVFLDPTDYSAIK